MPTDKKNHSPREFEMTDMSPPQVPPSRRGVLIANTREMLLKATLSLVESDADEARIHLNALREAQGKLSALVSSMQRDIKFEVLGPQVREILEGCKDSLRYAKEHSNSESKQLSPAHSSSALITQDHSIQTPHSKSAPELKGPEHS